MTPQDIDRIKAFVARFDELLETVHASIANWTPVPPQLYPSRTQESDEEHMRISMLAKDARVLHVVSEEFSRHMASLAEAVMHPVPDPAANVTTSPEIPVAKR